MKTFNYKGRLITAATKRQAVRKVMAEADENDESRYTDEELRDMAKKVCDKVKNFIESQRIDMDFLQRLSFELAPKLGEKGLVIEANGNPLFSYGHKDCWNNDTWDGNNSHLDYFRIEEVDCVGYIYFDVSNCKAKLSRFDVFNMHKMGSDWVYDDDAELDSISYDEL